MKIFLAVLVVLTMASLSSAQQSATHADIIFINGDIFTGAQTTFVWASASEKPHLPGRAQAIAVSSGKVMSCSTSLGESPGASV